MKAISQKVSENHKHQINTNSRHSAENHQPLPYPPAIITYQSSARPPVPAGGCPRCRGMIQPKLMINQPGDIYEKEADRVAEQVMRMPDPVSVPQSPVNSQPERLSIQRITRYPEKEIQRKKDDDEEEGIIHMKQ